MRFSQWWRCQVFFWVVPLFQRNILSPSSGLNYVLTDNSIQSSHGFFQHTFEYPLKLPFHQLLGHFIFHSWLQPNHTHTHTHTHARTHTHTHPHTHPHTPTHTHTHPPTHPPTPTHPHPHTPTHTSFDWYLVLPFFPCHTYILIVIIHMCI
jgi:hypothetical protein